MRLLIILLAFVASATIGCKTKKGSTATTSTATTTSASTTSTTTSTTSTSVETTEGAFVGKVSHKYKDGGCATVIIIAGDSGETVLIPKDQLAKDVDMDGQLIKFDYHALKMPQPAGCTVGIPVEVTNITKLK